MSFFPPVLCASPTLPMSPSLPSRTGTSHVRRADNSTLTHSQFFCWPVPAPLLRPMVVPSTRPVQPAHQPCLFGRHGDRRCRVASSIKRICGLLGASSFTPDPLSPAHIDRCDPPKPPDGHKRRPGSHAARAPHIGVLFPPGMEFVSPTQRPTLPCAPHCICPLCQCWWPPCSCQGVVACLVSKVEVDGGRVVTSACEPQRSGWLRGLDASVCGTV